MLWRLAKAIGAFARTKHGIISAIGFLVCLALVVLALLDADRGKRDEILQEARLLAQALDIEQIKLLTGTDADLQNPGYIRIKQQFAAIKKSHHACRFVYLTGRKATGEIFIFVDNEAPGAPGYSPPGDPYGAASDAVRASFQAINGVVDGPTSDRWGRWVSALVPIRDESNRDVRAVFGMDIDAWTWHRDVVFRAALPLCMLLGMSFGGLVFVFASVRKSPAPKPVLRRAFPALAVLLTLLVLGGAMTSVRLYRLQDMENDANKVTVMMRDLRFDIEQQSFQLLAAMQPMLNHPALVQALRSADTGQLLADWTPVFEQLQRKKMLTQLYFIDTNRVCLCRGHEPGKHGDLITHFVLQEAARTGQATSGIELGTRGTLSIRVVQPIIWNGALAGYVEMGKEIGDTLKSLSTAWPDDCLTVVIHKSLLHQNDWESSMRALGRRPDWDRLIRNVIVYTSHGTLPDEFNTLVDLDSQSETIRSDTTYEKKADGRTWHVAVTPLLDASGLEIGDLVAMHDARSGIADFRQTLFLALGASVVLLAVILSFVYVLLRRADQGVQVQQASLQIEKDKLAAIFTSAPVGMMLLDEAAVVVDINSAAQAMFTRCSAQVLFHQPGDGLNCIHSHEHAKGCGFANACATCKLRDVIKQTMATCKPVQGVELLFTCAHEQKTAALWLLISAEPVWIGKKLHVIISFANISERKQTEEALHASEQRYKTLFDSAADALMTLEPPDWRFTSGNPATQLLFGAGSETEFTSHEPWRLSPERQPDGRFSADKAKEMIETAMREGSCYFDWTHRRFNGEDFPATVLLTRIQLTDKTFLQATVRDISVQKQAEQKIRTQMEELTQWYDVMIEREARVLDVKKEVNELLTRLGEPVRYPSAASEGSQADREVRS